MSCSSAFVPRSRASTATIKSWYNAMALRLQRRARARVPTTRTGSSVGALSSTSSATAPGGLSDHGTGHNTGNPSLEVVFNATRRSTSSSSVLFGASSTGALAGSLLDKTQYGGSTSSTTPFRESFSQSFMAGEHLDAKMLESCRRVPPGVNGSKVSSSTVRSGLPYHQVSQTRQSLVVGLHSTGGDSNCYRAAAAAMSNSSPLSKEEGHDTGWRRGGVVAQNLTRNNFGSENQNYIHAPGNIVAAAVVLNAVQASPARTKVTSVAVSSLARATAAKGSATGSVSNAKAKSSTGSVLATNSPGSNPPGVVPTSSSSSAAAAKSREFGEAVAANVAASAAKGVAPAAKINRAYVHALYQQYGSTDPRSIPHAQQLCEQMWTLSERHPELISKFVLDHVVPPPNCAIAQEVSLLWKHSDRWLRMLGREEQAREVPKMLQALSSCFRLPHLLPLLSRGLGGGNADLESVLGDTRGDDDDADVIPQTWSKKTEVPSSLTGKVCTRAPVATKLRERRCGDVRVLFPALAGWKEETNEAAVARRLLQRTEGNGYPAIGREHVELVERITQESRRSLFVSNLPFECTDENVYRAYQAFGGIEHVEIFSERHKNVRAKAALQDQESALDAGQERINSNRFSSAYAIVTFSDENGVANASRDFFRVFGVLVTRQYRTGKGGQSVKEEYRATYPERAEHKNTLLITGLPWQFPLGALLRDIGRQLSLAAKSDVCLRLSNPGIYDFPSTNTLGITTTKPIERLSVTVSSGGEYTEVAQSPEFEERQHIDTYEDDTDEDLEEDETCVSDVGMDIHEILGNKRYMSEHHNDGVLALRFANFAQARFAKSLLEDFTIADRAISIDFSPRRRAFIQFDATGKAFVDPQAKAPMRGRYVDFMTPEASAVYPDERDNPFHAFGSLR
ncbi:unnamed protein product [Amoebophrya sp. A25]|nr:unnamed protein product [Amoebophrya sp. A25]|eukprot:GSA25T00005748001.1